ncbi:MAG: iron-containing alcohol dehydrogenase [Halioglobus sp.]
MDSFTFSTAKSIVNKAGGIRSVPQLCKNLGIQKPLLVTDFGIVSLGLHESLLSSFSSAGIHCCVFKDVQPDPSESVVLSALDYAQHESIDGIIGLGGGSSLDVAKTIAVLANSEQHLDDIYGVDNVSSSRLPLIQIPTTAGTGSEVTPIAVITTGDTTKKGIVSPVMLPDIALLDPELTLGLPPHITAATGIDAIVHAIEAYTSAKKKNPYSDLLARKAIKLLTTYIQTAVHKGSDLEARSAMMFGATLAGQAFSNAPVAAVHALAYPLGGHFHIPHGLSNALMLPHVMRFNLPQAEGLYAELAPLATNNHSSAAGSDRQRAEMLIDYLVELMDDLGMPSTLHSVGISERHLPLLAEEAMQQQRLLVNNPREVNKDDALNIYRASYT